MSRAVLFMLAGGIGFVTACTAVLGFESLSPYPPDSSVIGDATSPDEETSTTGTTDASSDTSDAKDGAVCVADFATNPKHCGRCGHDCLGGSCDAGRCTPIKLADGLAIPEGIAVDSETVFVAEWNQNRILKVGKGSLGPCTTTPPPSECVLTEDQADVFRPTAMGIDATRVYWANTGFGDHEIRSCPRAGCGAEAATMVAKLGQDALAHLFGNDVLPLELVIRDGQVFWPESLGGAIRSAPVQGDGGVKTYLEGSKFMPLAIAVDDNEIYFTDDTNQHPTQIQAVPRNGSAADGGPVRVVASTPARPYGIGLSAAGNLYWTVPFISAEGDGLVQSSPKTADGGAPIGALASAQVEPAMLIVDTTNVYWVITGSTTVATGKVVYCPLATGCPSSGPIILASEQRQPRHLAQDESAIYWSNEGLASSSSYDGQIWKVAKP